LFANGFEGSGEEIADAVFLFLDLFDDTGGLKGDLGDNIEKVAAVVFVLLDEVDEIVEDGEDFVFRVVEFFGCGFEGFVGGGAGGFEVGHQYVFLGAESGVEGGFDDAGFFYDLVDAGVGIALFVEEAGGGVDDRLADGVFSFLAHGFVKVGVLLTDRSVLFLRRGDWSFGRGGILVFGEIVCWEGLGNAGNWRSGFLGLRPGGNDWGVGFPEEGDNGWRCVMRHGVEGRPGRLGEFVGEPGVSARGR